MLLIVGNFKNSQCNIKPEVDNENLFEGFLHHRKTDLVAHRNYSKKTYATDGMTM